MERQGDGGRRTGTEALFCLALVAVNLLCVVGLSARVLANAPDNHWSVDHRWCLVVPVLTGAWVVVNLWLGRTAGWLFVVLIVSAFVCAGTILVLDHWNMLVQHDVWCHRGMPGFGER